ncbi:MAG: hypothetical protein ACRCXB_28435 [Aeromonadaceae bacterium]
MRRTETIEIKDGRDAGKKYLITEMDAESAEWWAFRALQAIALADVDMGDMMKRDEQGQLQAPLSELATKGLKAIAGIPSSSAKPLLDEMMGCVSMIIPAGGTRALMAGDIEDVTTRITLRKAVMGLHLGFSIGGDEQI